MTFHPVRCLMALLACINPAWADFKGSANFMTDQVYRGYSKSRGNPAVSGNLEYEHESGGYLGFWVSQVSFDDKSYPDRANVEISPYLGWTYKLAEHWRADFSASRYIYDGKLFGRDSDYNEFYGALHFRDLVTARIAFAYDAYQRKATTFAYELTGRYSPLDDWQLSVGLGFHQASELLHDDYFYWNVGLTWYPNRFVAADLRYVDANLGRYPYAVERGSFEFQPRPLDRHLLFSLSLGF